VTWKPDYVTVAEAKSFLRIGDTVDDTELALWVTAASRAIDDRCNRQFGSVTPAVARTYRRAPILNRGSGMWELEIDDVQTSAGLLVNGVAYASSGAVLLPDNAPLEGRPWTRLGMTLWPIASAPGMPISNVITAAWGWTAVPEQVKVAMRFMVNRWEARRDSPFGVAGSPDQGSELRILAKMDVDSITALRGLARRRRAG
jgi:hypothetical protein